MEDIDFLGFLERKLDNQIQHHEQRQKHTKTIKTENDDDLLVTKPILTKRVAMLLDGNLNKGARIGESKKDVKEREKIAKQLSFIGQKKLKPMKHPNEVKKSKREEDDEERKVREKKLILSKNEVTRNLHLFRGSKVPPPKPAESKTIVRPKPELRPQYKPKPPKPNHTSLMYKKLEKQIHKVKKPRYKADSEDSAMEVRDLYDIDEENENAFELGQQEEEEYERLLKVRKQYNKFSR